MPEEQGLKLCRLPAEPRTKYYYLIDSTPVCSMSFCPNQSLESRATNTSALHEYAISQEVHFLKTALILSK